MHMITREAIELHMLSSLARSQRALCRIIEAVADQVEQSEQLTRDAADNIEMLGRYQRAMIQKLTRLRPRPRTSSKPAPPWINSSENLGGVRLFPGK